MMSLTLAFTKLFLFSRCGSFKGVWKVSGRKGVHLGAFLGVYHWALCVWVVGLWKVRLLTSEGVDLQRVAWLPEGHPGEARVREAETRVHLDPLGTWPWSRGLSRAEYLNGRRGALWVWHWDSKHRTLLSALNTEEWNPPASANHIGWTRSWIT